MVRTLYKFTQFQIDLSWLGAAQSAYKQNMHCMPHSFFQVNFEFVALGLTSMSAVVLQPKSSVLSTERVDYSLLSTQYSIRCFGGIVPTTLPTAS